MKTSVLRSLSVYFLSFIVGGMAISPSVRAQVEPAQVLERLNQTHGNEAESTRLNRLFSDYWTYRMESSPEEATFNGFSGQNARWSDYSQNHFEEGKKAHKIWLLAIQKIDRAQLSKADQLSFDLFQKMIRESIVSDSFPSELMPIDQMNGLQTVIPLALSQAPKDTAQDYWDRIQRIQALPVLVDQAIALMEKGLKQKITPPRVTLAVIPDQLSSFFTSAKVEENPLYESFVELPEVISSQDQEAIRGAAREAIQKQGAPAFKKLHSFVVEKYLPSSRETTAWQDLPNGEEWYGWSVAQQTTTKMSPKEIHSLGLEEVKRIQKKMEALKRSVGFQGTLAQWVKHINSDSSLVHTAKSEFISEFKGYAGELDALLPKDFSRFPILPCDIQPVPQFSEQSQPAAYMLPGSIDQKRPSVFYANTFDLSVTPRWKMRTLFLHEAVPGHHFQLTLAQENPGLPEFRKFMSYTAFIEGWALYAETLGYELGFFTDPLSEMGQLVDEMMRAARLVVDTGLHVYGWSREQAIDYFKTTAFIDDPDATNEINRYLVMPGQALAYKIGQIKLWELRNRAKKELGAQFDVKKFHALLLENGTLPLDIAEAVVGEWISAQKNGS